MAPRTIAAPETKNGDLVADVLDQEDDQPHRDERAGEADRLDLAEHLAGVLLGRRARVRARC